MVCTEFEGMRGPQSPSCRCCCRQFRATPRVGGEKRTIEVKAAPYDAPGEQGSSTLADSSARKQRKVIGSPVNSSQRFFRAS